MTHPQTSPLPAARTRPSTGRLRRLFTPGPLDWLLKLNPPHERFRPGSHLHGLDRDPGRDP